jgi:hypothetical protein
VESTSHPSYHSTVDAHSQGNRSQEPSAQDSDEAAAETSSEPPRPQRIAALKARADLSASGYCRPGRGLDVPTAGADAGVTNPAADAISHNPPRSVPFSHFQAHQAQASTFTQLETAPVVPYSAATPAPRLATTATRPCYACLMHLVVPCPGLASARATVRASCPCLYFPTGASPRTPVGAYARFTTPPRSSRGGRLFCRSASTAPDYHGLPSHSPRQTQSLLGRLHAGGTFRAGPGRYR